MATGKKQKENLQARPPIVVILGHVDHGKSSILEAIKDLKITAKEAGGITQHTGAYQVEHKDQKITFIDTPGHEAFSAMRSRGAKVADIAILVVAAEEGIKPQTKEAIKHIQKAGLSMIVAINKIDKKEAQPDKVKQSLSENGVTVETWGGDIPAINVSAKTNQGIEELLEMINLVAEMEEFKVDPSETAKGVVIEAHMESFRGPTATVLVKEGILKNTDVIGTDSACGKIKTMEDFQSQCIKEAPASTPVILTGFNKVPKVGEKMYAFDTINLAQDRIKRKEAKRESKNQDEKPVMFFEEEKKVLNIILKSDVQGCLEAIKEALKSIPDEEVILRILKSEAGDVSEADIKLAESANAIIFGFGVKTSPANKQTAKQRGVKIFTYQIIYDLIQGIREQLSKMLKPEIIKHTLGQVKILAIFKTEKDRQIIGGKVISGKIKKNSQIEVIRKEERVGKGKITQLQRDKKEAEEVAKGQECGMMFRGDTKIEQGDILESFEEEKKKKSV